MTSAPLGAWRTRVDSVHVTRDHSAVVLITEESLDLYEWLRGQRLGYNGKAVGSRFRLTIDGVSMDARRVFVRYKKNSRAIVFLTITSWPGETAAAPFARKVGKELQEVELKRTAAVKNQGELKEKARGPKRVTVEGLPKPFRESLERETS